MKFATPLRGLPLREQIRIGQVQSQQARSKVISVSLTPTQVSANSTSEQAFTVTGVPSNAEVVVNGPSQTSGVVMGQAYVSDKDQVTIPFVNPTGSGVTPASGTYKVRVLR